MTEYVVNEITSHYPEQQKLLQEGIRQRFLEAIVVNKDEELKLFCELMAVGRLGEGECSAIACAIHRNYFLAMDDVRATKQARKISQEINILNTRDILYLLIELERISHQEADVIKEELKLKYRCDLKVKTFLNVERG